MSEAMNGTDIVLSLNGIRRSFAQGEKRLDVLRGVNAAVKAGELVALVGPSGAGKSTLLQIAGLLERADGGEIHIAGQLASALDDAGRTALRRDRIGFVYQFHHLLPEFSALENIVLPQMIGGVARKRAEIRARELLERVGLAARADHRPAKLSGGEQQRVAIARALANRPALLIADEPTGNLDLHTAESVFAMFQQLVRGEAAGGARLGALVATHNMELAQRMDRVVEMRDGVLVER
ncbi:MULTISPECIES: ABC transporter ATP-binding protein [unclassified Azospirillum]|uniref:ABC transporter ATP-binding protein n=1 Tax=unclassified Azospirillum TaxID=2630922 RepID=UPI000B66F1CC|nr:MULTISPECIES: ABC transporter ATP-binding protein [unclassified Azospirillum]SNS99397.1 lipoprotein-releasing system ATP-binding protein [Azospirillum sp. RU38E]SNT15577.1 lipoprotein-releasing system ATP-binding protein [Azospirillum sp. RU37A]